MTYLNNKPPSIRRLLLVGATGAVGRQVLALALVDPRIEQVVAPTRHPLPNHANLYTTRSSTLPIYPRMHPGGMLMQ